MSRRSIDLSQFDDDFRNEQPDDRSELDAVPDGKYQVNVEKVELTEAQSSGNPMLKWTLRIIAPRHVNRLMWRNSVFTANTLRFVKTDLHICGLDLEKLSDLPRNLSKLLDVKLEVTKKTKGDNENIYFNSRITKEPAMKPVKGLAGDDDVPF
ncbi:MAG TPA: DUF669 domain-containing protein [Bryobacteraceae bacterium]|jgi:hypothetical protein|nr:DUF669 domain-containing protein [Bryobacteraceae bacterium]